MNVHESARTAAASIVTAVLALFPPVTLAEVPDWIAASDTEETGRPLWVSAEEAAPNGFLRWELFDPHQQDWFREVFEGSREARSERPHMDPEKRCTSYLITAGAVGKPWSPKELLERAGVAYSASIEDVAPGFLNGQLGTMIHASVREVLKPPSKGPVLGDFLVFLRYAELQVEGGYLCARDSREPVSPRLGGLLILVQTDPEPDWLPHSIFVVDDTELFFDTVNGGSSAPFAYGEHGEQLIQTSALEQDLLAASRQEASP